jgi:hypothetical protein
MDTYGPKWTIPGGQTFVHLHNMIVLVEGSETKGNSLLAGDIQGTATADMTHKVGKLVKFKCDKSRACVEGRQGEMFINFQDLKFAKPEESLMNLATRLEIITHPISEKTGKPNDKWWQYPANAETPVKWQGAKQVLEAITDDKNLYNEIWQACLNSSKLKAASEDLGDTAVQDENGNLVAVTEVT